MQMNLNSINNLKSLQMYMHIIISEMTIFDGIDLPKVQIFPLPFAVVCFVSFYLLCKHVWAHRMVGSI